MAFLREQFPDVVLTYGHPLAGPQPGELTVGVGFACCKADRYGRVREGNYGPATVSVDVAGDLSGRPEVHVQLAAGDPWPLEWLVIALGFVAAEARDACRRVAEKVPEAWARAMPAPQTGAPGPAQVPAP